VEPTVAQVSAPAGASAHTSASCARATQESR
jgi:hypothetical protein